MKLIEPPEGAQPGVHGNEKRHGRSANINVKEGDCMWGERIRTRPASALEIAIPVVSSIDDVDPIRLDED